MPLSLKKLKRDEKNSAKSGFFLSQ